MGVLYGKFDLLDKLTAYKVRPAPTEPPGKFETGTGSFEGMCGVLGALEYIERVGETFGAEQAERYAGNYRGRRLSLKLGMSAMRSYEFELSRALLDILEETAGITIYGITDRKRLERRVPTCAFTLRGKSPRQVVLHSVRDKLRSWTRPISSCGMGIIMLWRGRRGWGWRKAAAWCAWAWCITTKHPDFECAVPALWGTLEEIRRFGAVLIYK
jgi:selenocysteine lyase/cysteine desulfurase